MSVQFHPLFKTIAERDTRITITLKNNIELSGKLHYIDTNLNMNITDVTTEDPHLVGVEKCFIRGNSVKFLSFDYQNITTELLDDLIRRESQKLE
ncbi:unnamed protein product [Blepharisma stoltei]|uniref:Sm domain-containing protein n=1 Tax=Blepharisma stoltei TaxID=1481888 RepID=A0AAU9JHY4_9CILI|nr:unnamed protein product [Blepharisma stoltei]